MNTKTLATVALLIAMSFVGAHLVIMGTVAFDSLPGFLAALLLGPVYGAAIGFLGHILTATLRGFPFSVPLHIVVALSMALTMYVFGVTFRILSKKLSESVTFISTGVVGVIFNFPVSLAFSAATLWLIDGREAALGLVTLLAVPLLMASVANIAIGIALFKVLRNVWNKNQ